MYAYIKYCRTRAKKPSYSNPVLYLYKLNRPLSSRQMKKRKLGHEGLVPESKGSQAL